MEIEVQIHEQYTTPKVLVLTAQLTEEVTVLLKKLQDEKPSSLLGYQEDMVFILPLDEIYSIFAENKKVYVKTETEQYVLKTRLYEIEERFSGSSFLRVSGSEIVNMHHVKSMDMSIHGTVHLRFANGYSTFVSRRCIKNIKNYFNNEV